jgi:Domain of unknown function (DUF397)
MPLLIASPLEGLAWHVARKCDAGNCVRVASSSADTIVISDSKNPDGPVLTYTRAEWEAFVAGVRDGDFDDLL